MTLPYVKSKWFFDLVIKHLKCILYLVFGSLPNLVEGLTPMNDKNWSSMKFNYYLLGINDPSA